MKVTISIQSVKVALEFVANSSMSNPHQPILKGVQLVLSPFNMRVATTNLELTCGINLPVQEQDINGIYLVEFLPLKNYVMQVAKTNATTMVLKFTDSKLHLSVDNEPSMTLSLFDDPSMYPHIEEPVGTPITIPFNALDRLLSVGAFTDPAAVPSNGIHIWSNGAEATTRFVGKCVESPYVLDLPKDDLIVSAVVRKPANFFKADTVNVLINKDKIYIYDQTAFMYALLIQATYYNLKKAWYNSVTNQLFLNRKQLISVIEVLSAASSPYVTVTVNNDVLQLSVSGDHSAEHSITIPAGEAPNRIVLKLSDLLMVLKDMTTDTVSLSIGSSREQIVLEDQAGTTYFIVPVYEGV